MRIDGKVVVVTGASSGIGRVLAEQLRERGATVVGCARDGERLRVVADRTGIDVVQCDVTVAADRERLVSTVLERHGRIDVLVNNAGIGWEGLVVDMTSDDIQRLYDTNVVALIDLTRLVLPHMLERRSGAVVMTSSGAAFVSFPPLSVYASTKFAVDGFVQGLRREVGLKGIQVHSVNPGLVSTEWLARSQGYRPSEGEPESRLSPGIPASWVGHAVIRSLRRPYSRTVSVPRVVGLARLLQLQPLRLLLDLSFGMSAGALARKQDEVALRRVPDGTRPDAPAGASPDEV